MRGGVLIAVKRNRVATSALPTVDPATVEEAGAENRPAALDLAQSYDATGAYNEDVSRRQRGVDPRGVTALYNRILVATDGSETAHLALKEALRIAKGQRATVRIVHVTDPVYMSVEPDRWSLGELKEAAAKAGRAALDNAEALAAGEGVHVESRLVELDRLDQRIADAIV
jgi:hypothetical protein